MTALKLDSVTKVYSGGHLAVSNLSLDVTDGEFMVLLGPSGCGKSTVLRMIAGLEEITSGDLWFGRTHATHLATKDRGVAMVFQTGALYPTRTVRENITFPLMMAREDPAESNAKATGLARVLGIEKTLDRMPRTLSGGERQRAAIGRAIVRQPKVFLMDEPLSNLDAAMRTELRQEVGSMTRDLGVTTVYVTHDQVEALTLADRVAIMREGQLEDVGTPGQVFEDPSTAFVAGFLGSPRINLMAATVRVAAHRRVVLDFGRQSLSLPRTDRRAMALADNDGMRVVVGARTEAFTLAADSGYANQLSGRLRTLEYHGHHGVAFVESGIEIVNPDTIGLDPERQRNNGTPAIRSTSHRLWSHAEHAADRGTTLITRARTLLRLPTPGHLEPIAPPPTHRRADLVLEVEAGSNLKVGEPVHLTVDILRIHIFDQNGRRVDRVTR